MKGHMFDEGKSGQAKTATGFEGKWDELGGVNDGNTGRVRSPGPAILGKFAGDGNGSSVARSDGGRGGVGRGASVSDGNVKEPGVVPFDEKIRDGEGQRGGGGEMEGSAEVTFDEFLAGEDKVGGKDLFEGGGKGVGNSVVLSGGVTTVGAVGKVDADRVTGGRAGGRRIADGRGRFGEGAALKGGAGKKEGRLREQEAALEGIGEERIGEGEAAIEGAVDAEKRGGGSGGDRVEVGLGEGGGGTEERGEAKLVQLSGEDVLTTGKPGRGVGSGRGRGEDEAVREERVDAGEGGEGGGGRLSVSPGRVKGGHGVIGRAGSLGEGEGRGGGGGKQGGEGGPPGEGGSAAVEKGGKEGGGCQGGG